MKFIHTADLHLGASLKSMAFSDVSEQKKRVHEIMDTFYQLLRKTEEDSVDCLFIVGDLFDHPYVSMTTVENVFKQLSKLSAEVFIVIGNHDTFLHNSAYQRLLEASNIHVFDKETSKVVLEDTDVYGINTKDFTEAHFKALSQSLDKDKQNILLLHGDVTNKKDDHFLTTYKTLDASPFDYIALGHIHKHAFLSDKVAYSGNLEPSDFGETGDKGYIEGVLNNKALALAFKTFAKRTYQTFTLNVQEDDDFYTLKESILAKVPTPVKSKDFVRITLKGTINPKFSINQEELTTFLRDDFYYLELKDETTITLDLERLKNAYKDTLIESLILDFENEKPTTLNQEGLKEALLALLETEEGAL